jgi:hypothetical protein
LCSNRLGQEDGSAAAAAVAKACMGGTEGYASVTPQYILPTLQQQLAAPLAPVVNTFFYFFASMLLQLLFA